MFSVHTLKKESHLPFRLTVKLNLLSFVLSALSFTALSTEPRKNSHQSLKQTDLSSISNPSQPPKFWGNEISSKDSNLEFALKESILYFKRIPKDTKFQIFKENYTNEEILSSIEDLQTIVHNHSDHQIQTEIKKRFQLIELKPLNESPTITGYYEVRIQGKTKPDEEHQYPVLSLPKSGDTVADNPIFFHREKWNQKSIWEKYSRVIVFLRLTDLHLAQLEGSAFVETETKETFRINYAGDNGKNYISPSVYLQGICPSLKPYHLANCFQSKPKEVTEAILKNPRYIFFEKETLPKIRTKEYSFGPMGSGGIRLVSFRSVAMDKQIPLGLPVLLSFQSDNMLINNHLVFVHDRGNAIFGEGRLDYYLGSGDGVEEAANNLLTKGKVILLLPKRTKKSK
ncbi:MltA domain-containing protein [Leptospira brenneri]|uniref:peptidoglycan lytic exotransglycosylase n=1 Tax=Leptospira brenneri TaxID=2023182 RepID=A0A2M9Y488_9LEPT|nr:MltA domain-containing protein [Leptospira brenneri]PJZ46299.1 murein transglycosylase [Leptospira brenneri]TGK96394.1 murein transglycosylase [Leptospira brenneri]